MNEIEGETVVLADWPDGSRVIVDRYRADLVAPWAYGMYEAYCGSCQEQVHEASEEATARIKLLEHLLSHAFEEIQEITRWIKNQPTLGRLRFENG